MSGCDRYRIEADEAMRDYDALELDAGIMLDALEKIAQRCGIVTHTETGVVYRSAPEWTGEGANRIAREALEALSEYASDMRAPRAVSDTSEEGQA